MATPEYYAWLNAGSHYEVARPIVEITNTARAQGIAVLGIIGDNDHLTATFPEDHTPYSYSAYPVELPGTAGYWVCACDIANVNGWGPAILRDARAGKLPWLKYMNFGGFNYGWTDGFQHAAISPDQHIHLSVFSNMLNTSINGYNPIGTPITTPGEVLDMNGELVKGGPDVCVAVPVITGKRRVFSLSGDLGTAQIRVAFGKNGNKWEVHEGMYVGSAVDPWTPDLAPDVVKISMAYSSGDGAVGWSVLYV